MVLYGEIILFQNTIESDKQKENEKSDFQETVEKMEKHRL